MSSKILKLALAVESSDLSQAEKKKFKENKFKTNLRRVENKSKKNLKRL